VIPESEEVSGEIDKKGLRQDHEKQSKRKEDGRTKHEPGEISAEDGNSSIDSGPMERLCAGCWCMWWRLKRSEFDRNKGAKNKAAMNKIVRSGQIPGILGYLEGKPVAWCSVGPRETYPTLGRSRVLKRIDDKPVWSVVCLFIAKPFRQKGVSVEMLKGAVEHAKRNGAEIVEGYPVQPKKGSWPDAFLYVGLPSAFKRAGFKEAHRPSRARSIMRYILK
jgi:GNAT superfamily N-acetyltransferase